jgi:drug/metabolite transporter (DMT)-like permease
MTAPVHDPRRAVMFMAAYTIGQSLVWIIVRHLSQTYSPEYLVFCRKFFGFLAILPLLKRQGFALFSTRRPFMHAVRGTVACIGVYSLFFAVTEAPLATVVAVTYSAPIMTAVVAVLFLKEALTPARGAAITCGFIGMILVVQPGEAGGSTFGVAAAVLGAVMTAGAFLSVKLLSRTENPGTMVALQFVFLLPVSFLVALPEWQWPPLADLALMAGMGIGFTLAQSAMARAFALADAMVVLPVDFLRLIIAAVAALILFGEMPEVHVIAGAALILGAAVMAGRKGAAAPVKRPEAV